MIKRLARRTASARRSGALLALWLACAAPALASSPMFEAGQEAYVAGDIETALTLWRPLAEHGDAEAQFAIGTLYYGGIGVPVDRVESSYWFLRAAQQGYVPAQYNLGNAYKRGEGVRQNDRRAVMWWRKAAEQGFGAAQFNLANAYFEGAGVEKNREEALRLLRLSAENGHYPAVRMLRDLGADSGAPATPTAAAPQTATTPAATCGDWLASLDPRAYTLQLMSSTQRGDARELAARHALAPHAVCAYDKDGQRRHALLYGVFGDTKAAQAAASALPEELRRNRPWVRRVRAVQRQFGAGEN